VTDSQLPLHSEGILHCDNAVPYCNPSTSA
jgi:hypothetical protein